jgi:hypothetical protein
MDLNEVVQQIEAKIADIDVKYSRPKPESMPGVSGRHSGSGDSPAVPTKPDSVGFVGSGSGPITPPESELAPVSETRLAEIVQWAAIDLLNQAGARQFYLDGRFTIGLWSAADSPELRAAIAALHGSAANVVHLEEPSVPETYRRFKPDHLRTTADRTPVDAAGRSFHEWKASMLNRIFKEHGGELGRIIAATVRHGEQESNPGGVERLRLCAICGELTTQKQTAHGWECIACGSHSG